MDSTLTIDPSDKALARVTKGCKPGDQISIEGTFTVGDDMSLKLDSVENYEKVGGSDDESDEDPAEEKKESPDEEKAEDDSEGDDNPDAPQGPDEKAESEGTPIAAKGTTPGGKQKMHLAPALVIAMHMAHPAPKSGRNSPT